MSRGQARRRRGERGDGSDGSWSAAWSAHIDGFGDFADRRERGRCYSQEGAVLELKLEPGRISALVQGGRVYRPTIVVQPLPEAVRAGLRAVAGAGRCSPRALLRAALTTPRCGVLPPLRDLAMVCTCPDRIRPYRGGPCKHLFAALYAVGPRLDADPALLFTLRGAGLEDLCQASGLGSRSAAAGSSRSRGSSGSSSRSRGAAAGSSTPRGAGSGASRIVAQRRAPAKRVRLAARRVRRAELRALGIPARTIDGWLSQGILLRTAERGVYGRTAAVDRRLTARGLTAR